MSSREKNQRLIYQRVLLILTPSLAIVITVHSHQTKNHHHLHPSDNDVSAKRMPPCGIGSKVQEGNWLLVKERQNNGGLIPQSLRHQLP
mmetsp:Transcript_19158/g.33653  ORF Transcript_19158/g.33653 Transcript_19158/m.33653 type:complete len:89 (+) Transcript_19158:45-311(+)